MQKYILLGAMLALVAVGMVQAAESSAGKALIVELERQRCEAISKADEKALQSMLAEDYVHVHGTGKVDSKNGFIANVLAHPRRTERGELTVRLYQGVAVLTGEQFNYLAADDGQVKRTRNYVTQVLERINGHWLFVSFQLTPISAP
jgi:Domain of unknown function (DUF4440)